MCVFYRPALPAVVLRRKMTTYPSLNLPSPESVLVSPSVIFYPTVATDWTDGVTELKPHHSDLSTRLFAWND